MEQILADLFIGEWSGGWRKNVGQLIDLIDVCFLCPLGTAAQDQSSKELLA